MLAGELAGDPSGGDGRGAVLLDPAPGGYKVGESVIPEQFHDARMARHLDAVRALPSWSPKTGTLFADQGELCCFPLAQHQDRAMHVLRQELEALLAERLGVQVVRERVLTVDGRTVRTDRGVWRSEGPVLDCSGPAMVVASARDEVEALWPVWASWAYHDAEPAGAEAFWQRAADRRCTALDVPSGRVLPSPRGAADPGLLTNLVRVDDGLWLWQIPLYRGRVISVGAVSRTGPIDAETYAALVTEHGLPAWQLSPRAGLPADATWGGAALPEATRRFHQRGGFARKATRAASEDHVLLGDAFAFADPVYSVGTGLAVTQALHVADRLRAGPWDAAAAAGYSQWAEAAFARATEAFQFWYDGRVLASDDVARAVQDGFLVGEGFRAGAFAAYSHVVSEAMRAAEGALVAGLASEVAGLPEGPWQVVAAPHAGTVLLEGDAATLEVSGPGAQAWQRVGELGLSYRGAEPPAEAVVEALSASLAARPERWRAALAQVGVMRAGDSGPHLPLRTHQPE